MAALSVFIIAGEPSGDRLGAAVMVGLKAERPDVVFDGVGGPLMQAEGLVSRFPMQELSVMGIAEILPKYRALKRRIRETADQVVTGVPDVMITIDSPDFSLRVAKLVKAGSNIRTVHYVAPSVWAWRAGRAAKMARVIDHVLALLPFEPPLMQDAGMACDFVGHPVVGEPLASDAEIAAFRRDHLGDAPTLLVLPGSRRSEVGRLSETFGAAVSQFAQDVPGLRVVVPTLAHLYDDVSRMVGEWDVESCVFSSDSPEGMAQKRSAFATADMALAASGTVSLELAANATPMVIAYDMNRISRAIIRRMLRVDTVTLVNLVSETRVVPEFIFGDCQADKIAGGLGDVWADRNAQDAAMDLTMERLGRDGLPSGVLAARAILGRLSDE